MKWMLFSHFYIWGLRLREVRYVCKVSAATSCLSDKILSYFLAQVKRSLLYEALSYMYTYAYMCIYAKHMHIRTHMHT